MSADVERRKQRQLVQREYDARMLMADKKFRRFAYWLLFRLSPVDGQTFAGENTHRSAFNEGRRSVAIDIGRLLRSANLNGFQRMEREADEAQDDARESPEES